MNFDSRSERSNSLSDIEIIQGGMGIGVSCYKLAGAVAAEGAMGVVSGTAIGPVLARKLQEGDPDGYIRQALNAFPDREIANQIVKKYFAEEGHEAGRPYKSVPLFNVDSRGLALKLNMAGAFAEVWLAKNIAAQQSDKPGLIGINLLTKLQAPTLSALFGAMLAEVDCVIMGAGIPHDIPRQLGNLALGIQARLRFEVSGSIEESNVTFNPADYPDILKSDFFKSIKLPSFLAIVASNTLATRLSRNEYPPTGFIIEGPTAGGHNAPPRDKITYGDRDHVDLGQIAQLSRPFWLAGGYDSPEMLKEAQAEGATGVQVGSAFAVCEESGINPSLRERIINQVMSEGAEIVTDMLASPTGFPFKIMQLSGTMSEDPVNRERTRVCDLGFLREAYVDGTSADGLDIIKYRCAAEPEKDYIQKGGNPEAVIGRICLCNGLMATIGLGQTRHGITEKPIVTAGDTLNEVTHRLVNVYGRHFSAKDVVMYLRGHSSDENISNV